MQPCLQIENRLAVEETEGRARKGVHRNILSLYAQEVPGPRSLCRQDDLEHHQGQAPFRLCCQRVSQPVLDPVRCQRHGLQSQNRREVFEDYQEFIVP